MQCSVKTESDHNCGNVKMKTINGYKNPYKKEPNLDIIVDQLATRLQDIKDREGAPQAGMPTRSIEQAEAVRRYYAAFPALKKGDESPLQYYLPPPAWCRPAAAPPDMQSAPPERRRGRHERRRGRRARLPAWATAAAEPWRAGLDEGYGTCEHTRADDAPRAVPDWDDALPPDWPRAAPLDPDPLDLDLYAKFEAKFDRSLEALWARDQNTPDDDYQELPIDFASLLASPSDRLWDARAPGGGVWAASPPLHDRLRPLHLASPPPAPPPPAPPELESFALLYDGDELGDALAAVAGSVRSLTAINHSRDTSGFAEVPPRRRAAPPEPPRPAAAASPPRAAPDADQEDLLTSARTHFRPIRREAGAGAEAEAAAARYADGDTFDIRGSLEPVEFRRSASGGAYLGSGAARALYLEYRGARDERGIDYGRLALTAAQRAAEPAGAMPLPLRFAVRQRDAAAQTDGWPACDECAGAAKKMRPDAGIWSSPRACRACAAPPPPPPRAAPDELARDWEELLADISAAHAHYAAEPAGAAAADEPADRKRRHSAALRCARQCAHPHARFLPCAAFDRPLTR